MPELKILKLGEPVLRERCRFVVEADLEEVRQLSRRMFGAMELAHGVGLAAPQVGSSLRFFITKGQDGTLLKEGVYLNPMIRPMSKVTSAGLEGCLSLPGTKSRVMRFKEIELTYFDSSLQPHTVSLNQHAARIAQHEVDHLDGRLILDRK